MFRCIRHETYATAIKNSSSLLYKQTYKPFFFLEGYVNTTFLKWDVNMESIVKCNTGVSIKNIYSLAI